MVERAGTGDLATRSSVDVATVGTTVRDVVPVIVIAAAQLTLLFGAVFLLHPLLGLVALAGLPVDLRGDPLVPAPGQPGLPRRGRGDRRADRGADHDRRGRPHRRGAAAGRRPHRATAPHRIGPVWATRRATLALRSVFFPVVEASYALPVAAVLLVGGYFLRRGMVSLGEVVAAALYLQQAIEPLDRLLQWIEQAQRGIASFARVLGVGQVPPEPRGRAPCAARAAARGARGAVLLRRTAATCCTASTWRCGPASGSPSSARPAPASPPWPGCSPASTRPREGVVSLGGCPVTDLDPAERRRRIALVTQEHHVFIGSLRDNLAFAAPDASDDQMRGRAGRRGRRLVRRPARRPRHPARRRR